MVKSKLLVLVEVPVREILEVEKEKLVLAIEEVEKKRLVLAMEEVETKRPVIVIEEFQQKKLVEAIEEEGPEFAAEGFVRLFLGSGVVPYLDMDPFLIDLW